MNNKISIDDMSIPLVISYENNFENNENSKFFKHTLENCGWEYKFIGEGIKWNGFIDRILGYYNELKLLPENKIVVLSDARDVFCLRTSTTFIDNIKHILKENKILVSAELFLIGHMDWTKEEKENAISKKPNFFYQGDTLDNYWKFKNIDPNNLPLRKYVNGGLIAGEVKNLLKLYKWIYENNIQDDQLGIANYTNTFPELVELDIDASILHTSSFGVAGSFYSKRQMLDAPSFDELYGLSTYFLHIPGVHLPGQKSVYMSIFELLKNNIISHNKFHSLYKIPVSYNPIGEYSLCKKN